MDDLARIERNYGCVAEYNRCQEEQTEREMNILSRCAANKAKLDKAKAEGKAMFFCEDCIGCKHYESIGPTTPGFYYEDIDDVEHGICHHEGKPFVDILEPFCKGREEEK